MTDSSEEKTDYSNTLANCYMNRELSWLLFNERCLNEAGNPAVPLAERSNAGRGNFTLRQNR